MSPSTTLNYGKVDSHRWHEVRWSYDQTTTGIADELGIEIGDWIEIRQYGRTLSGEVTDIGQDGDCVELNRATGVLFDLEGADVTVMK